jgi:hypothetical protein
LVDAAGVPVTDVTGFLRLLVVRDYSPNTVRAYALPASGRSTRE